MESKGKIVFQGIDCGKVKDKIKGKQRLMDEWIRGSECFKRGSFKS